MALGLIQGARGLRDAAAGGGCCCVHGTCAWGCMRVDKQWHILIALLSSTCLPTPRNHPRPRKTLHERDKLASPTVTGDRRVPSWVLEHGPSPVVRCSLQCYPTTPPTDFEAIVSFIRGPIRQPSPFILSAIRSIPLKYLSSAAEIPSECTSPRRPLPVPSIPRKRAYERPT